MREFERGMSEAVYENDSLVVVYLTQLKLIVPESVLDRIALKLNQASRVLVIS